MLATIVSLWKLWQIEMVAPRQAAAFSPMPHSPSDTCHVQRYGHNVGVSGILDYPQTNHLAPLGRQRAGGAFLEPLTRLRDFRCVSG